MDKDYKKMHFEIFKITLEKNLAIFKGKDMVENDLCDITDKCQFETDTILHQYLSHNEEVEG